MLIIMTAACDTTMIMQTHALAIPLTHTHARTHTHTHTHARKHTHTKTQMQLHSNTQTHTLKHLLSLPHTQFCVAVNFCDKKQKVRYTSSLES